MSVTPGSFRSFSMSALTPSAWPGTVNAARPDFGSSGGSGWTGPIFAAMASAIFSVCRDGPDAGAVDAAAAAVDEDAVGHDVEVLLPLIDLVVAEEDLAEAGAVRLHARVALVLLDGRGAAEDQAARAVLQHRGADVAEAGVDGDGLLRNAGLDERAGHAIGRPRLLRAGLEHEADLHRNDRQPERVNARASCSAAPCRAPATGPDS